MNGYFAGFLQPFHFYIAVKGLCVAPLQLHPGNQFG